MYFKTAGNSRRKYQTRRDLKNGNLFSHSSEKQGEGSHREFQGTLSWCLAHTTWPIFSARTGEKAREMAAASAKDADPSESGLRPPVLVLITSSETPLPNAASLEVMLWREFWRPQRSKYPGMPFSSCSGSHCSWDSSFLWVGTLFLYSFSWGVGGEDWPRCPGHAKHTRYYKEQHFLSFCHHALGHHGYISPPTSHPQTPVWI